MSALKTKIGDIEFDHCLMNASGPICTTASELDALKNSSSAAVVSKSCTIDYREGNPLPRYYDTPWGSINSMGLPNNGIDFYLDYFDERKSESGKPSFLSIAGLSHEENVKMLRKALEVDSFDAVEFNLSCPNIPGKPQTAYDFERTEFVLEEVFKFYNKPLGIKLPPYFDFVHFEQMAKILNRFPLAFVTCINSLGNGLYIDPETDATVIKPKKGFGGIGGGLIKPTALANVSMFYELLEGVPIIGCGGVQTGRDVYEHILCGASVVQVGTVLKQEGVEVFSRLKQELLTIMESKGYTHLDEFRGKLIRI